MCIVVPDQSELVWEKRRFDTDIVDNPLAGPPRPELDDAWHELLRSECIPWTIGRCGDSLV
jgi:hypothetical protein